MWGGRVSAAFFMQWEVLLNFPLYYNVLDNIPPRGILYDKKNTLITIQRRMADGRQTVREEGRIA